MTLFTSQAEAIIKASLMRGSPIVLAGDRVDDSRRAYNYYKSIRYQEADLRDRFDEYYDNKGRWRKQLKVKFNITKRITDTLSTLFDNPSTCKWDEPKFQKAWDEIQGYNRTMQKVDRYTFLTGLVAVRPIWNEDEKKIEFAIYKNHQILLTPNPVNPSRISEACFIWKHGPNTLFDYWNAEEYISAIQEARESRPSIREILPNPYGTIPASFFVNLEDEESPYGGEPAIDLVDANLALNKYWTNLHWIAELQAYSMLKLKNAPKDFVPKVGPGNYLQLDKEGDADYITPNPNLDQVLSVVNHNIDTLLASRNIPESTVRVKVAANSAAQVIAEQKPLADYRASRSEIFREPDQRLRALAVLVKLYHEKRSSYVLEETLPYPAINYKEPDRPLTDEDRSEWDWKISHNLATEIDIIRARDPEISEDDALKLYEKNQEFNAGHGIKKIVKEEEIPLEEEEEEPKPPEPPKPEEEPEE